MWLDWICKAAMDHGNGPQRRSRTKPPGSGPTNNHKEISGHHAHSSRYSVFTGILHLFRWQARSIQHAPVMLSKRQHSTHTFFLHLAGESPPKKEHRVTGWMHQRGAMMAHLRYASGTCSDATIRSFCLKKVGYFFFPHGQKEEQP